MNIWRLDGRAGLNTVFDSDQSTWKVINSLQQIFISNQNCNKLSSMGRVIKIVLMTIQRKEPKTAIEMVNMLFDSVAKWSC